MKLLQELFILEGIFFDPNSVEDLESAFEDVTLRTISSLQQAVEELVFTVEEVREKGLDFFFLLLFWGGGSSFME